MADKSLMEEMLPMKISNWESIEYSEGLNCPNEECDNKSCSCHARNIIGWCDTPYGYMMVCECKKCFTKYRFHGTIDGKFDFENFADNFLMRVEIGKKKNYSVCRRLYYYLYRLYSCSFFATRTKELMFQHQTLLIKLR